MFVLKAVGVAAGLASSLGFYYQMVAVSIFERHDASAARLAAIESRLRKATEPS